MPAEAFGELKSWASFVPKARKEPRISCRAATIRCRHRHVPTLDSHHDPTERVLPDPKQPVSPLADDYTSSACPDPTWGDVPLQRRQDPWDPSPGSRSSSSRGSAAKTSIHLALITPAVARGIVSRTVAADIQSAKYKARRHLSKGAVTATLTRHTHTPAHAPALAHQRMPRAHDSLSNARHPCCSVSISTRHVCHRGSTGSRRLCFAQWHDCRRVFGCCQTTSTTRFISRQIGVYRDIVAAPYLCTV